VVVGLKGAGSQIGWGFHMQNPWFLGIMVVVLIALALNMFGLYEFKTPFGNKLGGVQLKEGIGGDFASGVLATILSTPCSAPFLGTALTFAFTTSNLNIFLMFFAVGIGLASPFIVTGIFPQLVSFLPSPGAWMNTFKKFMGVTLLLTALWLGWVFTSVVGTNKIGNSNWSPWTEQRMMTTAGPVFVDFTAKWCLTCKANKALVLNTNSFQEWADKNDVTLMVADWTKYDPVIAEYLKKNGHVGVPVYFLKMPDGTVHDLGETISVGEVKKLLDSK
jgi:thiol:disulfide interchange protein